MRVVASPPAISILMPVWNGAPFIDAALASLATQSFGDFEIIAVNNGSTDGTAEMLSGWARREPRLRVASLARSRLASALNLAATLARAPLLARLEADDVAFPRRLEIQAAAMAEHPEIVLLGSSAILVDTAGRKTGSVRPPLLDRDIRRLQQTSAALIASTTMFRAEAFRRAGSYREGLNISEDFDLWLRMSEVGEVANLPDTLICYRVHPGSITARQPVRMAIASIAVAAAAEARRAGTVEPFTRGVPNLRRALPLLGLSRAQARRSIRLRSTTNLLGRRLIAVRLPLKIKRGLHELARFFRLKRLYRLWLMRTLGGRRSGPRSHGRSRVNGDAAVDPSFRIEDGGARRSGVHRLGGQ